MKKIIGILILFVISNSIIAQVTFRKYTVPMHAENSNYRLVTDYFSEQQVLFPILKTDSVYVKSKANESFKALTNRGLYITAFYSNNGDLYMVENSDTLSYEPHLYKSVDNGSSFTEINGISGRTFRRDQYGNLFYSIPNGFAFSSDNGVSFKMANTPDTVYSVCRSSAGTLFFIADSLQLYRSVDNGVNWQNISRIKSWHSAFNERSMWELNDTLYIQSANQLYYNTENDTLWKAQVVGSTSIVTNAYISPDRTCFLKIPFGFLRSNTPSSRTNWETLDYLKGLNSNSNIYNHFIAITDSSMYYFNDTNYLFAARIPNKTNLHQSDYIKEKVSVYPNPSNPGVLYLNKLISFKVYTSKGECIETIESSNTLNTKSYPMGIYFIVSDSGSVTKFMVLE